MREKLSLRQEQNIRYWTEFCDYLRQRGSQLRSRTSKKRHFIDFRIGTGCFLRARQVIKAQRRDEVYRRGPTAITAGFIMTGRAITYFHSLEERKQEINSKFDEPLEWFAEWKTERHVALREEADPTDENDWPRQHEWLATKLEKLNEVFRPCIVALNAGYPLEKINTGEESFVEEMEAPQDQLTREFAETRDVLKSVVEEIRGVREDLKIIRRLLGEIV